MPDAFQILERLNGFYSGAFNQLITFTVGLLALVGVLIPVAIAAYQNRQLRHDQKLLTEKIENDLAAAKLELTEKLAKGLAAQDETLKGLIESTKQEIANEIKKTNKLAIARALHLQANSHQNTAPASSALDSLAAATAYASGKDERNLRSVLAIWEECIKNVKADDFKHYDLEDEAKRAIEAIESIGANGRYAVDIRSIQRGVEEAKIRT